MYVMSTDERWLASQTAALGSRLRNYALTHTTRKDNPPTQKKPLSHTA